MLAAHPPGRRRCVGDEEEGDHVKYSTRANAEQRTAPARIVTGFRDEPGCFLIDRYVLHRDEGPEGYITDIREE